MDLISSSVSSWVDTILLQALASGISAVKFELFWLNQIIVFVLIIWLFRFLYNRITKISLFTKKSSSEDLDRKLWK